ncbi:MAG: hypothetical protein COZ18_08430 [Flexibacter sp. CG_4_10_14_3_um_filter_32_15]|nr:MAG: hypothetical protein COZ18_08430 [Flexibacter sp. CG_4_10_14_3_um_filter_32_15]
MQTKFNIDKAKAATLYIFEKFEYKLQKQEVNFLSVFKILYFADQKHLVKYGRTILTDEYIAMKNGAMPSNLHELFKSLYHYSTLENKFIDSIKKSFFLCGYYQAKAIQKADLDELSKSDIECLDSSFEENNSLSFEELAEKSKDKAWKLADFDNRMNIKEIAKAGKASQEILLYIESHLENQTIYFSTSKVNV